MKRTYIGFGLCVIYLVAMIILAVGTMLNGPQKLSYDEFIKQCDVTVKEATIGTNITLHQTIQGIDGVKYRYKLKTDCPHWKYDDRYVSDEPLDFAEGKTAAVETNASELTVQFDGETLLTAQHFYVPLFNLYDNDVTFDEFKDQQLQIAYQAYIASVKPNYANFVLGLLLLTAGVLFFGIMSNRLTEANEEAGIGMSQKQAYETLSSATSYRLPIKNGYLDVTVSADENYPGLDIEYIDAAEEKETEPKTRPRMVVDCPRDTNTLRAFVWGRPDMEDFSMSVDFETASDRV